MENQDFNNWYLRWSSYACRANVGDDKKMYAFRKCLNTSLHQKIIALSPQPANLTDLVNKARDLDAAYHTFKTPTRGNPRQGTKIRAVGTEDAADINATQPRKGGFKKRGPLSDKEKQYRRANNLCLYCGKPGHMAAECRAKPNKRPNPPGAIMRQVAGESSQSVQDTEEPQDDPSIGVMANNQFAPLFNAEDSMMADNVTDALASASRF